MNENYLCVCQYGHSRSVALCRVLHHVKQQAVAVGFQTAPAALISIARTWATKILILDDSYLRYIPEDCREKVVSFHVGPDRWSNPYNVDLLNTLAPMVEAKLGITVGRF